MSGLRIGRYMFPDSAIVAPNPPDKETNQLDAYMDAIHGLEQLEQHWRRTHPNEPASTFLLALANELARLVAGRLAGL